MASEVVNVLVAFALVYLVVRWFSSGSPSPNSPASILGFTPRKATEEMITTVHAAFPDIPRPNIHYDLLRTGSAEVTSNKILERGVLDAPPASYFRAFPLQPQPVPTPAPTAPSNTPAPAPADLISRFQLNSRVSDSVVGSSEAEKSGWQAAPEKREANLRERKAQMILEARKRMAEKLARQKAGGETAAA